VGGWLIPCPGRLVPEKETRYPFYRRVSGPQGLSGRVRKKFKQFRNFCVICRTLYCALALSQGEEVNYRIPVALSAVVASPCKTAVAFVSEYTKQVVLGAAVIRHSCESLYVTKLNYTEIVLRGVSCLVRTLIRLLSACWLAQSYCLMERNHTA
jgi:hypothetical protein